MTSMNMTERDTHFSRLVAYGVAEVNQSLALVTFPTPPSGFEMSYVGMTHDLDPDGTYVAVVCGHTRPSACAGGTPHVAAPGDHPCGVDDAADPATGPFCEVLALSHPSTEHGELLVHASEVLDSVAAAWAADARNYENPHAAPGDRGRGDVRGPHGRRRAAGDVEGNRRAGEGSWSTR